MNKQKARTVDALLKQGYGVQFQCPDFTLLYKPDMLSSTVKLVWVDNEGHIDTKPLSTILEELYA
jgi:hypothetical protein